jgi:hypothetical protein
MTAISRLILLVLSIVLSAHFIACAFHKIALLEYGSGMSEEEIWIGKDINSDISS